MIKLEKGLEQQLTVFECPHCDAEEIVSDDSQPDNFECIHVSCGGTIRVWLCCKCNKHFHTTFPLTLKQETK